MGEKGMNGYMSSMRGEISGDWKSFVEKSAHDAAHLFLADREPELLLSQYEGLISDHETGEPTPLGHLYLALVCMFKHTFEVAFVENPNGLSEEGLTQFVIAALLAGVRLGMCQRDGSLDEWHAAFVPEAFARWAMKPDEAEKPDEGESDDAETGA